MTTRQLWSAHLRKVFRKDLTQDDHAILQRYEDGTLTFDEEGYVNDLLNDAGPLPMPVRTP